MNKFCGLLLLCAQFQWSASALTAIRVNPIDRINKVVVDTLKTCYKDEKTIVVHSDSDESTIRALANSETFAMILYKEPLKISRHIDQQKEMPIFLMTTNSFEQTFERLWVFKRSPWWNVMATFFFLDTSNSNCKIANWIHDNTWDMSIINSFFVCLNDQQEPMFHMYNPYTNRAPSQWTQLMMRKTRVSDRWTTYSRQYIQGRMCDGLKFDKTKFLDGARVSFVIYLLSNPATGIESLMGTDYYILNMMELALNVIPILVLSEFPSQIPAVVRALEDELLDFCPYPGIPKTGGADIKKFTFPVMVVRYNIITYKGHYTSMENIWNYYGTAACVAFIFILVIIYVALIIMLGTPRRYGLVALELLRLLLNISMITPMNNRRHKIYFMMIFSFFLVLHTEIDGQIASWLTKPVPLKLIDSYEDLYDERIRTIYFRNEYNSEMFDEKLRKKLVLYDISNTRQFREDCTGLIAGNGSVACIDLIGKIEIASFGRDDVYVAKKPINYGYAYYFGRNNWPLRERVDIFLMRLKQYGIYEWFQDDYRHGEKSETPQTVDDIKVTLTDFMPVLYIWAFGNTCSIICFIIELIIGRRRSVEAAEEIPLDAEFVEPPAESAVEEDISALPSCSFHHSPQCSIVKSVVHHQQHQKQSETEL